MKVKEFDDISNLMINLEEIINQYDFNRNQVQRNLERIINYLQVSEKKIYTAFFKAKLTYKKKNQYYTKIIQRYKEKAKVGNQILENLIQEEAKLSKPNKDPSIVKTIEQLMQLIQDNEYKLAILNQKIQDKFLDISEENRIIDIIEKLSRDKELKLKRVMELKKNVAKEFENSEFYTIQKLIEVLEERVEDINASLTQFTYYRLSNHKDFLKLYRNIKNYESIKTKIGSNFSIHINFFEHYQNTFAIMMEYDKKQLFKDIYYTRSHKKRPQKKKSKKVRLIIKKKKLLKKLKEQKLKEALYKQKAGQKLDFYELKLIIDQLKKE